MSRVSVTPETFQYVDYDSATIAQIAEELAGAMGFPADVEISIDIDEELPLPLTGSTADVVDGRAVLWYSGANFEDGRARTHFDTATARTELALGLLRAHDRLRGFSAAPVDEDLTDAQRNAWEVWAEGRAQRLGEEVRPDRRQYCFRLYNGFTDVGDAAFDRLWNVDELDWAALEAVVAQCAAADERPKPTRRTPVRKETLKAPAAS
jgi:hypothetical protein